MVVKIHTTHIAKNNKKYTTEITSTSKHTAKTIEGTIVTLRQLYRVVK